MLIYIYRYITGMSMYTCVGRLAKTYLPQLCAYS